MRLDLFLKWSRVVLRRTLAKQLCDAGRVTVNQHESGAGRDIQVGDTVEIDFPRRWLKFSVRAIPSVTPGKDGAKELIKVLEERRQSPDIA